MVNFLANLVFWIAYPFIWLFHPKLFKLRVQALRENEFFQGAVQITAVTVCSLWVIVGLFTAFQIVVHVIPQASYDVKNQVMSDNDGLREEEVELLDTTAEVVVPKAADVDYGNSIKPEEEYVDPQTKIDQLKEQMKNKKKDDDT